MRTWCSSGAKRVSSNLHSRIKQFPESTTWRISRGLLLPKLLHISCTPPSYITVNLFSEIDMATSTIARNSLLVLGAFAAAAIAAPAQETATATTTDELSATCVTAVPASTSPYDIDYAAVTSPYTDSSYDVDASFSSAYTVGSTMVSHCYLLRPGGIVIISRSTGRVFHADCDSDTPFRTCISALLATWMTMPPSSASTLAMARRAVCRSSAAS